MIVDQSEVIKTRESDDDLDILDEARARSAEAIGAWDENFKEAKKDLKFIAGEQWPSNIVQERKDENRPMLTMNKLPQYIDQILGDVRMNRPGIHVHQVHKTSKGDDVALGVTANKYTKADVLEGLIRNIEYVSESDIHEDTACQHAIESGFGWLRVFTKYSSDSQFDQDLCIRSIRNRFSVLVDPSAQDPMLSDMNYCLIGDRMRLKEFNKRYPDAAVGDLMHSDFSDEWWYGEDTVTVAEYFRREPHTYHVVLLSNGVTAREDEIKDVLDELEERGVTVVKKRKVDGHKVVWRKITGHATLEKDQDWIDDVIPVVPVLGKETVIGERPIYRGLVRNSKDAQRMHNFWYTAMVERAALSVKAPYIVTDEQIEGYEALWAQANRRNLPYLKVRHIPGAQLPRRDDITPIPAAEMQIAMASTDEIKQTIGIYDASLGAIGNETSGKAILARQKQGDRGSFVYLDNLTRAKRRVAKILIRTIPKVYDSERIIRIRFPDESGDWVQINHTIHDEESGEDVVINDLGSGKFDVSVQSGPSYQTQRQEAADAMIQMSQHATSMMEIGPDIIMKNMDWPGADEFAERYKKTLPKEFLDGDEDEEHEEQQEEPPPDPAMILAQKEIEVKMAQADADLAQAEADKIKAAAEIAEVEAGPDVDAGEVRQLVAQSIAEYIEGGNSGLQ